MAVFGGLRGVVLDKLAMEMDVVLFAPPHPGKARWVDGMDKQNGGICWQLVEQALTQPAHLEAGATEALAAMGAGHGDQEPAGFRITDQYRVGGEVFTGGTACRIAM